MLYSEKRNTNCFRSQFVMYFCPPNIFLMASEEEQKCCLHVSFISCFDINTIATHILFVPLQANVPQLQSEGRGIKPQN